MMETDLHNFEVHADADLVTGAEAHALIAEIRRLRGLVKAAARSGPGKYEEPGGCPWCGFVGDTEADQGHAIHCPAFTPYGEVK